MICLHPFIKLRSFSACPTREAWPQWHHSMQASVHINSAGCAVARLAMHKLGSSSGCPIPTARLICMRAAAAQISMAPLSTCIGLAGFVVLQDGGYGSGISVSGQQATYTGSIVSTVQSFDSKIAEVPLHCRTLQVRLP